MSYKNDIALKLTNLLEKGEVKESEIIKVVERVYHDALMEGKIVGQSIESITYEVLEGVETSLKSSDQKVESILEKVVESITKVIHKSAKEDIQKTYKAAYTAEQRLYDRIDAEKANLLESLEASKAYAKEKAYHHFEKQLEKTERNIDMLLNTLEDHK